MAADSGLKRLRGKVAIVTGSGAGIGRAEARLFAAQGAKVVVNDIAVKKWRAGRMGKERCAGNLKPTMQQKNTSALLSPTQHDALTKNLYFRSGSQD